MKIYTTQQKFPKYMKVVDDKLIRGKAVTSPITIYKMKQSGINQIIDLRNTRSIKKFLEILFCNIFKIKYKNFKYSHRLNYLPEKNFFEKINNTIVENNGKTYIHCQYGKRRTGVCVALYEKFFTSKENQEIINNMINIGFKDTIKTPDTKKSKKYTAIINDLINTYFNH